MPPLDEDAASLAEQWRAMRRELLALSEQVAESRLWQATDRAGWTLKHELAHAAALDHEIAHLIEAARARVAIDLDAWAARRLRGQPMFDAQQLRLSALREHLAEAGERAARAIEGASEVFDSSVTLAGQEATTLAGHIQAQVGRAHAGIETFRRHMP